MTDTPNKHFCIVPWTHTFLSPQCERRLCCSSREEHQYISQYLDIESIADEEKKFSPLTLKEHWNSDFMKSIRKRMLKGEKIAECQICDEKHNSGGAYKHYFNKQLFPELIRTALETTKEDGETQMLPRSFDYRLDNRCNFKCRMCGDLLSSSWENEKVKNNQLGSKSDFWMKAKIKKQIVEFQSKVAYPEFKSALLNGHVEEIYWVGGEPLIWDFHWDIMNLLIEKGLSKSIHVRYNTNLSKINFNDKNLFTDILPNFKSYLILASIDATGEIGEYIRTGLNWSSWLENYKLGLSHTQKSSKNSLQMDLTITLPGLFDLDKLLKLSYDLDSKIVAKHIYAFDPSILLSPLALPRDILDSLITSVIKKCVPYITENNRSVLNALFEIKNAKTFEEQFPKTYKDGFIKGRDYLLGIEQTRKDSFTLSNIYGQNQLVLNWWKDKNEK